MDDYSDAAADWRSWDEKYAQPFLDCLKRRKPQLEAILQSITNSKQMARDAAYEAIMVAYGVIAKRCAEQIGDESDRWNWLIGVGRHKAFDIKYRCRWSRVIDLGTIELPRKRGRRSSRVAEMLLPRISTEDEATDEFDCLYAAIDRLSPYLKAVFLYLCCDDSGHTQEEAAKFFGVTVGVIAGKVRTARNQLRDELSMTLKNVRNLPKYLRNLPAIE